MKIFDFAKKELELIASKKSSLLMVTLYPLLIVIVIFLAFGSLGAQPQSGLERVDVAYYLPENSQTFDSVEFLDKISSIERLRLHSTRSVEALQQSIDQGITRVGIVVQEPRTKFEQVKITAYYDNSAPLVSSMVMSYMYLAISSFANEKSTKILNEIWANLGNISEKLDDQYSKISSFEKGMDSAKQRMADFETKINSINLSALENRLSEFDTYYADSKQKIASSKTDIADAKSKLISYEQRIDNSRNELATYSDELKGIRSQLQSAISVSPEPVKSQLQNLETQLSQTISKIDSTIAELDSAKTDIESAQVKLDQIDAELDDTSVTLDYAKQSVEDFKTAIKDLSATLAELKALIKDSYDYYDETKQNLAQTKILLDELTATLEDFMQYKPGQLVKPFIIQEQKMYLNEEKFEAVEKSAILIPISLTIVLLLTCILFSGITTISERREGIAFRLVASPTKKITWLSGKVLGQIIFALIESIIIFGFAFFVFSVPLIGSPTDLLFSLALISFSFIAIGIFLSNFTNEQSTLILISLVIMIPLLFLSGLIFPIEFMPLYIQGIASSLPLTVGNSLLTSIVVKGIPIINVLDKIALLFIPAIILLAFTLINKKV